MVTDYKKLFHELLDMYNEINCKKVTYDYFMKALSLKYKQKYNLNIIADFEKFYNWSVQEAIY